MTRPIQLHTHTTRGPQERVVTRRVDGAGRQQTEERAAGVADPHSFDAEWRSAADRSLPRGGGFITGSGGGGQQQQQRLAPPGGGRGQWQQQQWGP